MMENQIHVNPILTLSIHDVCYFFISFFWLSSHRTIQRGHNRIEGVYRVYINMHKFGTKCIGKNLENLCNDFFGLKENDKKRFEFFFF
jgi:hypothetical protein